MKSTIFAVSTALAAIAALFMLPVSVVATGGNAIMAIGILAIFAVDYGRTIKPRKLRAPVIAFGSSERMQAGLDAAA